MRAVDLIQKKRDGGQLAAAEIGFLVRGLTTGEVPDYQWAALLMAILWRGMDADETAALVDAMLHSGTVIDLTEIPGPKVDKHSTGGVGDKTSLILAPIVAACGVTVPMVSGRGLGHTGGTLDKLESIPGLRVNIPLDDYRRIARDCGLVFCGQTAEIAPADRQLYALRDATATVESIPLITASILSKKLAEGIDALVLDVKCGDGAFMPGIEQARSLATGMATIGTALGTPVRCLITAMDAPLGRAIGNALEVAEAVACLRGEGPADLMEVTLALAAEMLLAAAAATDRAEALDRCRQTLADGSALARLAGVVAAQGGDPRVCDDPAGVLPAAGDRIAVPAPASGFLEQLPARAVGQASMLLGAGRARVDSRIDPAAGVVLHKQVGDRVQAGETIAELHVNQPHLAAVPTAMAALTAGLAISQQPVPVGSRIIERLSREQQVNQS